MSESHTSLSTPWCLQVDLPDGLFISDGILQDTDEQVVFSLFKQIVTERQLKNEHYEQMLDALCIQLLIFIKRLTEKDSAPHEGFQAVLSYIELHYSEDISLPALAALSGYSYEHFRHLFKKAFGISLKQYLIKRRLHHAKRLLETANYSASYIAQLCGFPNYNQFAKQFASAYGTTPSRYQKA